MGDALGVVRRLAAREYVRQSAIVFAGSLLGNVLGYAFQFAVSRRVGVVDYGVLSALSAGFMLALTVPTIAATVVVKYVAELRAAGDPGALAAFVRRTVTTALGSGCAVAAVLLASAGAIGAFLHVGDRRSVDLVVAIVAMTVAGAPLRAVFQGVEEFATFSGLMLTENLVKAAFGSALAYAGYGVAGAFFGWATGSLLSLAFTTLRLLWRFRAARDAGARVDGPRLVATAANVAVATVALSSIGYLDVVVVKHYADPSTAGLYGALALSGKILLFVVAFVPTIVLPQASRLALGGRSPFPAFARGMALVVAISALGLAAYAVAPRTIVTVVAGPAFAPAAPYVLPYAIAMVSLAALGVVVSYKTGLHRFDFVAPLGLVALGEAIGLIAHHRTLRDVIAVLIVGNAIALVTSLYRIDALGT